MNPKFESVIRNLPQKPGVYRYYGAGDMLLYIGKAKNLKNRVSSYFQDGRPKNERLTLMISQIDRIEFTVVESEKESLILEANLVHELQPKFNILLKDDKNYLYVRVTNSDPIPGIFLTRRKFDPRSSYFGPYTKRYGIFNTLRTIRTIIPYCQERFAAQKPCSYVGIRQCEGICVGRENIEDYSKKIAQIENILEGRLDQVKDFIREKIKAAIEVQNFELAALWRDRFNLLTETIQDQKIILPHPQDVDLITLVLDQTATTGLEIGSFFVQNIRGGKIVNVNNFLLSGSESDQLDADETTEFSFLKRFFSSYYVQNSDQVDVVVQAFKNA
ncbi:MAG: GIY-YIG nuclease family protein [bacterium]